MVPVMLFVSLALWGVGPSMCETERDKPLLRTEFREASVEFHVDAHGEIQDFPNQPHHALVQETLGFAEVAGNSDMTTLKAKARRRDMCNLDFTLGVVDNDSCRSGPDATGKNSTHEPLNQAECRQAAMEAHAVETSRTTFILSAPWIDEHPAGCFAFPCNSEDQEGMTGSEKRNSSIDASKKGICYYYNPRGYPLALINKSKDSVKGTPICKRPRFLEGTKDTLKQCPHGYIEIADDTLKNLVRNNSFVHSDNLGPLGGLQMCDQAHMCLSKPRLTEYIANRRERSDYDRRPKGCFLSNEGNIFYNEELDASGAEPTCKDHPSPNACKGTPVCIVAEPVRFGNNFLGWKDPIVTKANTASNGPEKANAGSTDQNSAKK